MAVRANKNDRMSREHHTTASNTRSADKQHPDGVRRRSAMLWRMFGFLLAFGVLQGLYTAGRGGWVERLVIDQITVKPAAWLISLVDSQILVRANGRELSAPGGGIVVLNGCEGTEVLFLLIAAMLTAPLTLRARLAGMLVGAAVVYILNQARVISLFYAFRADKALFEVMHGIVAPMLLIVAAAAFFVLWLQRHSQADLFGAEQPSRA